MWPTLISIGPIAIHSFGVMLAVGFFIGGFSLWKRGNDEGLDEEKVMDAWLVIGILAFVLARIGYVLDNYGDFGSSLYKILFVTKYPGLSMQGAMLGVGIALVWQGVKNKWNVFDWLEMNVFSLVIFEIWAHVGSFLAGSNLGKETTWFWGLNFPGVEIKRHPVDLIWILVLWIAYKRLLKWEKEYRSFSWYQQSKGESKSGFLIASYLMMLGLLKIVIGLITDTRTNSWGISLAQICGLILLVLGSLILVDRSGIKIVLSKLKVAKQEEDKSRLKLKTAEAKPVKVKSRRINKRKKKGFDYK